MAALMTGHSMRCLAAGSTQGFSSVRSIRGQALRLSAPSSSSRVVAASRVVATVEQEEERFRLDNVGPQPGARRRKTRVGRGYGAGQGGTCGDGMRGQKARSGGGIRPGFEGGQMPLYRRLPKLRGICGGMSAGVPRYVTVNLDDLSKFAEGDTVSLQTLQEKKVLNLSGRDLKLPLKVLGDGELKAPLTIKAVKFSGSAREKIQAAGGKIVEVPTKVKWTKALGKELAAKKAAAAPAGKK